MNAKDSSGKYVFDLKNVLIVDDIPKNIDLLKGILSEHYHIQIAKSGKMALDIVNSKAPDIILLDIMMPEMNGFEVCRILKSNPKTAEIPVIFLTALTDMRHEKEGFEAGCVDFITKPISPLTTLARVQTHLEIYENHLNNKQLITQRTKELDSLLTSAIGMLAEAGHHNDTDTGVHMWRMADYSAALAKGIGWSESEVELLQLAAPLHDTGKVGIPDSILKSPNKLTEEEWVTMRKHPDMGYQILSKSEAPLFKLAASIAFGHHEKWDGSGYPLGLAGEEIPIASRIVALADVFDALTMKRPYKKSWAIEEALQYIKENSGSHFDPNLVESFIQIKDEIYNIKQKWKMVESQED
ncbi:MAG: putative two-component system response regulator [Psychromonas sp.]|jgi:putative two-component system response regulator|uniref:HD domain-containing phosphohydrolase n=1 Tax=Psychromonas sp. TaxID=1884585 RepID=UPI0039E55CE9